MREIGTRTGTWRLRSAALAGFLLPWQTVLILRPGMLGGVPWPLATIGVYASDLVLGVVAIIGMHRFLRRHGENDRKINYHKTTAAAVKLWEMRNGVFRHWATPGLGVLILFVLAVANVWVSADPWLSAVGWLRLLALILALAGLPYSERMTRAFLSGFLVAMAGQAILGIAQFVTQSIPASTLLGIAEHAAWVRGDAVVEAMGGRWLRAYGGFPHPNVFGTALLVALAALVAAGHAGSSLRPRGPQGPEGAAGQQDMEASASTTFPPLGVRGGQGELRVVRNPSQPPLTLRGGAPFPPRRQPILTFAFCILTFALVLTFSRAALLGLGILLIVCAYRHATRRLAVIGVVTVAIGIALTWPFWVPRVAMTSANEARSRTERTDAFRSAGILLLKHPFIGVGLHAMPVARFALARDFTEWESGVRPDPYAAQPVHSVPLLALAEIGPIGILVLVLVLVLVFVLVLVRVRQLLPLTSYLLPLFPSFLLDHHLWSLPIGLALVFVLVVSVGTLAGARRS